MNSSGKPIPPNIPQWLLPLTVEEQSLLEIYERVRALEREAKIGASMAAKAKLVGDRRGDPTSSKLSNEELKKSEIDLRDQQLKQTIVNAVETSNIGLGGDYRNENTTVETSRPKIISTEDEPEPGLLMQEQDELRRRQNEKLYSLRLEHDTVLNKKEEDEETKQKFLTTLDHNSFSTANLGPVPKKKQPNWNEIEAMEASHLETIVAENTADSLEISLKRKRRRTNDEAEKDSVDLSDLSLSKTTNALYDLSSTLDRNDSRASGSLIFPDMKLSANLTWLPPPTASNPQDGCLLLPLVNADSTDPDRPTLNTIVINLVAPSDSKRFSFNITTPENDNYNKILFHFNPRQFQKGGMLVLNHKAGLWGQAITIPLALLPIMFGEPIMLIIQITNVGFDVFIQGQHCARMEHRTPLKVGPLILQFPSTDDYGAPENVEVYKVWFGYKECMASKDLSEVFGVDLNVEHPKKLFIRGLTRIRTDSEVEVRRAELERAFKKYGGALGVQVTVSKNTTFAFVEVETEKLANLALSEMSQIFTMTKARRSREESALEKARSYADSWD